MSVILTLDVTDSSQAEAILRKCAGHFSHVKIGHIALSSLGLEAVQELCQDLPLFLDLKFHDIPNTTANAVAVAADLGVWMVNVHASGGRRMMEACAEKLSARQHKPLLIGVTVLTSMQGEDLADIGLAVSPLEQVTRLAALTKACGLDGVVCSSHEVADLKAQFGKEFKLYNGRVFKQGKQRRKRFECVEVTTGKLYLFNPNAEVELLEE